MGIFKRRRKATDITPLNDQELAERIAADAPQPMRTGLLKLLPFRDIIKGITDVIRDPNGKISSKRAGAGALITAGIYFLEADRLQPGIVCLGFALALFFLTKWDVPQSE